MSEIDTTPIIHPNGTGKEALIREAREAKKALGKAREALLNITVHERDFYPSANYPKNYNQAVAEHFRQIDSISEIISDLLNYQAKILEQGLTN